tara:strand:- start:2635 stop:2934 length:300 start_codon:yes stop_codon:yes gene_type:complete
MLKVEYIHEDNFGELELENLSGYSSKDEIESSINSSDIEYTLVEDLAKLLASDIDTTPQVYACERGGERNLISPESEARRFGFTKIIATIGNHTINIFD